MVPTSQAELDPAAEQRQWGETELQNQQMAKAEQAGGLMADLPLRSLAVVNHAFGNVERLSAPRSDTKAEIDFFVINWKKQRVEPPHHKQRACYPAAQIHLPPVPATCSRHGERCADFALTIPAEEASRGGEHLVLDQKRLDHGLQELWIYPPVRETTVFQENK